MPSFYIKYEYPCGYKVEIKASGWGISGDISNDDKPTLCPLHKKKCKK